jgi:hypothetical protein
LFVEPSLADNEFLAEIPDMRDGPAKATHAELEEHQQYFERRASAPERWRNILNARTSGIVGRAFCGVSRHAWLIIR